MILIPCPWCGPRDAAEFRHVGEIRQRPDVAVTTPVEWRSYLYVASNPAGWTNERWYHRAGCRRFLRVERHTVTNEVRRATPDGSRPNSAYRAEGWGGSP